jgi:hypothetical protein
MLRSLQNARPSLPPDTLDDAYASLSATLPGVDARPPKHQRSSLRRYKRPEERRADRPADVRRRPAPEPANELGPCKGCRHQARCTAEIIACDAFILFARLGDQCGSERWKFAPRFPSRAIMERLVGSARESKLERRRAHEAAAAELQRRDAQFGQAAQPLKRRQTRRSSA